MPDGDAATPGAGSSATTMTPHRSSRHAGSPPQRDRGSPSHNRKTEASRGRTHRDPEQHLQHRASTPTQHQGSCPERSRHSDFGHCPGVDSDCGSVSSSSESNNQKTRRFTASAQTDALEDVQDLRQQLQHQQVALERVQRECADRIKAVHERAHSQVAQSDPSYVSLTVNLHPAGTVP